MRSVLVALLGLISAMPTVTLARGASTAVPAVICPESFTGRGAIARLPVVARTDHIPAYKGFGFSLQANLRVPEGAKVEIVLERPSLAGPRLTESFPARLGGNGSSLFVYRFDKPEEMPVGDWVVTAQAGETVLYRKTLTIYAPTPTDGLLKACNIVPSGQV